jgi:hypothetical protein
LKSRLAAEGTVHTSFNPNAGYSGIDDSNALADEGFGPFGIVDIARAVQYIELLAGVRDRAKQWIITSLAFLLAIESNRGSFDMAWRAVPITEPLKSSITRFTPKAESRNSTNSLNNR